MPTGRDTLLTVAVPTFNGALHLRATLESIRAQQCDADFEWVVCDDRSDDDSAATAAAFCLDRARVVVNSERLGLAGNWNRCIELARTPLVAVVHQDDLLRSGHLAAHLRAYRNPSTCRLGLLASGAAMIDDDDREIPRTIVDPGGLGPSDREFAPGEMVRWLAVGNPLRCSAVTIVKEAHADVGGFDPALRYVVDWDFWVRVAERWGVSWMTANTIAMRWHHRSETHRFKTGTLDLEESAQLFERISAKHAEEWPELPRIRRQVESTLARALLNRAYDAADFDATLSRRCLVQALRMRPALAAAVALDPRLALKLTKALLQRKA